MNGTGYGFTAHITGPTGDQKCSGETSKPGVEPPALLQGNPAKGNTNMTDANTTTVQFWIAVDEAGNHYISSDSAADALSELQGAENCEAIRTFEMNVVVPLPKIIAVKAVVPETDGPVNVTVTA